MRPHFLVSSTRCPNLHHAESVACSYRVAWSINPHMQPGQACVNGARAAAQHHALRDALKCHGATVDVLHFVHGAYDSVFTKDMALLATAEGQRRALLASPRFPERAREQRVRARSLARLGFQVNRVDASFEGGDVVVVPNRACALVGHGFRTSVDAHPAVASFLGVDVVGINLVDPRLFHLDMALSILNDGTAFVCKRAISDASMRALERAPGIERIVVVSLEDALAFGLNMVRVGESVIGALASPLVRREIEKRGFFPVPIALDEFHRAGGSAACLVARVHEIPRAANALPRETAHSRAPCSTHRARLV